MDPKNKRDGDVEIDPFEDVEIIAEEDDNDPTEHQPDGDESGNEQENEADSDREGAEDSEDEGEEKPQGSRAERRIRQLVTRTKVMEQALRDEQAARQAAEAKAAAKDKELESTQRVSVDEVERRLTAEEANLEAQYKEASEEGDSDRLWKINQKLTQLHVNKAKVEDWKQANKAPVKDEAAEDEAEKPVQKKPGWKNEVDKTQALSWVKKHGDWFGKTESAQTRAATKMALEIDMELKAEGFDPADAPSGGNKQNEFYMELDKRIADAFPTLVKKGSTSQGRQTMGSGGRSAPSKGADDKGSKPKLTQKELDMCVRMGITPKNYDNEKKRLAARNPSRGR